MVARVVVVLALVGAGCVGAPALVPAGCAEACEVLVDGSGDRAFEPDVAVDPRDPLHLVVGSTVFHESDEEGTPVSLKVHVSFDGGASWDSRPFPGPVPPGHPMAAYTHAGDPSVAILDDGTVLYAGMFATGALHPGGMDGSSAFRPFDIVVARSEDGGRSFSSFVVVAEGRGGMGNPPANPFPGMLLVGEWPDHPMLAAGPGGRVLLGYQLRSSEGGPPRFAAMVSVSTDSGRSWSSPVSVREGGEFGSVRPSVLEDGSFWVSFRDVSVEPRFVWTASSRDGVAWDARIVEGVRTGWAQDSTVRGADRWIVLAPGEEGGVERIHALRSSDGGATWRGVEVDVAASEGFSMPQVAAAPDGVVVTYYWHGPDGSPEFRAARVSDEGVVTRETLSRSPIGKNEFLGRGWAKFGDYVGLASSRDAWAAAWVSGDGTEADVRAAVVRWS